MDTEQRQLIKILSEATDTQLRNALNRLDPNDTFEREVCRDLLTLSKEDREGFAERLAATQRSDSKEVEGEVCVECGKTMRGDADHQLDTEKASDMCWECWMLVM